MAEVAVTRNLLTVFLDRMERLVVPPPEIQSGNPAYCTSQVSLIRKEIEP